MPASMEQAVEVINSEAQGGMVLVCEHASNAIPGELDRLGLTPDVAISHAAWDPGALALAERLSSLFNAPLVAAKWSRLVYDCNRPPESPGAMVESTDGMTIPGNVNLSASDRQHRVKLAYNPFRKALRDTLVAQESDGHAAAVVTVHSFTPLFNHQFRSVELGILHDSDSRLADAMLQLAAQYTSLDTQRNQPYSAADGVTHTLQVHALSEKRLNVMLEVRNDLLSSENDLDAISVQMHGLIKAALEVCRQEEDTTVEAGR